MLAGAGEDFSFGLRAGLAEHLVHAAFLDELGSLPGDFDVGEHVRDDGGSGFGVVTDGVDGLLHGFNEGSNGLGLVLDHVQRGDQGVGAGLEHFVAIDVVEVIVLTDQLPALAGPGEQHIQLLLGPLIGMLAFGNFVKQCGVVDRLSKTMENELLNIVSILLSLGVGSQMTPEKIMNPSSLGIIALGLLAFAIATAGGLLMAKLMNLFLKEKINPLIGSAGVSAVPMAARVANKVGMEYDPSNFLLMHAMGPNVSGVIGTAIAAGVFIATYAK